MFLQERKISKELKPKLAYKDKLRYTATVTKINSDTPPLFVHRSL